MNNDEGRRLVGEGTYELMDTLGHHNFYYKTHPVSENAYHLLILNDKIDCIEKKIDEILKLLAVM